MHRAGERAARALMHRLRRRLRAPRWRRRLRTARVLLRVWGHFLPLWGWQLGLTAALWAGISAELAEPWLHQRFVNRVLLGRQLGLLPSLLALYAVLAALQWCAASAAYYCHLQAAERYAVGLRLRAYTHLRRLGLRGLRRHASGEVVAALQQFAPEVADGYLTLLQQVLTSLYRLPASVALMARLNGPLLLWTAPALALYPLYPLLTARPLRRALGRLALFDVRAQGVVQDRVAGLPALLHRVDAREDREALGHVLWQRLPLRRRVFVVDRLGGLLDVAARQGLTVLLLGLGGLTVWQGRMSVGALLAFLEYVRGLEGPVRRLMHLPVLAQHLGAAADRVYGLLDEPLDVPPPRRGRSARQLRGEIAFHGVTVRGDDGRPIVRDITFTVPAGCLCAVVGSSGAGKSTLAACIPRHLDPDAGAVLLDGCDLRAYDLAELRRQVALVAQEPAFFRDTVWANLALARFPLTPQEAWAALRRAHAEEFLRQRAGAPQATRGSALGFPSGADPAIAAALSLPLAEGARNLSGGQRQRLALARAYLQGARVLVLDEALAGLDPALQQAVWRELAELRGRCTVILVTHQWELAQRADRVAVLHEGHLVSWGPPAAVLPRGPAHPMPPRSVAGPH